MDYCNINDLEITSTTLRLPEYFGNLISIAWNIQHLGEQYDHMFVGNIWSQCLRGSAYHIPLQDLNSEETDPPQA
jgi:hypothetical protein